MKINQFQLSQVAEIELSYRPNIKPSQRPQVNSSKDVYQLLIENWDKDRLEIQEQFKVMLLNRGNRVMGIVEISSGGIAGTIADPKLIYAAALKAGASTIILAHNHPSGLLTPSQADLSLTRKIKNAGDLLDISVFDHLIITTEGFLSLAEEGLM